MPDNEAIDQASIPSERFHDFLARCQAVMEDMERLKLEMAQAGYRDLAPGSMGSVLYDRINKALHALAGN